MGRLVEVRSPCSRVGHFVTTSDARDPARVRLLHVSQPIDGGTARLVVQLAAAGVGAGHLVTVASPYDRQFVGEVETAGAAWLNLPMTRVPTPADLWRAVQLRRLMADCDVVHLHSSKAGAIGRLAGSTFRRRRRPRVVFTPHGWSFYVGGAAAVLYRLWERALATAADLTVVVSHGELSDGYRALGPRARLRLIENGVDLASFSPEGMKASRTSAHLLVQVGRLSRQKAQDRSIRALADIADRTARLRLIGDGPMEAELRTLARDLGVGDRVEFVGSADPRPHLRAADVVLLPSRWEGMSLSLLEAMASGKTVLTTDCGGSEALGNADLLVPHLEDPAAVDALVRALDLVLDDRALRVRLGREARERAERGYDLARVGSQYLEVWQTSRSGHGVSASS